MKLFIFLALTALTNIAYASCSLSDIKIKSLKAKFVNKCSSDTECFYLEGVAVLENKFAKSVGVQLQITGYDAAGEPVATNEFWPSSIRNIQPGPYTFSLNQHLQYEPSINKITIKPINITKWK